MGVIVAFSFDDILFGLDFVSLWFGCFEMIVTLLIWLLVFCWFDFGWWVLLGDCYFACVGGLFTGFAHWFDWWR